MSGVRSARSRRQGSGRRTGKNAVTALLGCGIAYPVVYAVTNDLVAASRYDGYCRADQAISELSAVDAPTRPFLTAMVPVQTTLMGAYGVGVWRAARGRRALRGTAAVLLVSAATNLAWLPFPMSSRADIAAGATTTRDTGHLVLAALNVAEFLALFGCGSTAFGPRFRAYTALSGVTALTAGALTSMDATKLARGEPTPNMGVQERICIGTWLLWLGALATALLRERLG